jgi:hypothetical protein
MTMSWVEYNVGLSWVEVDLKVLKLTGQSTQTKNIMDKYYEIFRGKNSVNKKDFFNSPDSPEHSDQDSDTDGWTRLRRSWGLNEEKWVGFVCEKQVCHVLWLHSLSFIKISY